MAAEPRLFPPTVSTASPACPIPNDSNKILSLRIPFQLNKGVSWADLKSTNNVSLILKTVNGNKNLLDGFLGNVIKFDTDLDINLPTAHFEIPVNTYKIESGTYYKAQIAFISTTGVLGYYSDVTLIKITETPEASIAELDKNKDGDDNSDINDSLYVYTGIYENSDTSEKAYSYEFQIVDMTTGLIHDSSGELLHNSSTDTERDSSTDIWTSYKSLQEERKYLINYTVKTINGLKVSSPSYLIGSFETLDLVSRNTEFVATLNSDNAYVHIHILPKDIDADIRAITGNFVLVRASSEDNFSSWHEIYRFTLINNYPLLSLWKDFTVQQGYSYKYAVQAYNSKKVYSNRLECKYYLSEGDERKDDISRRNWNSNPNDAAENYNLEWHYLKTSNGLPVDFEDAFLFDGKKQLKIKYNPKISSFKTTILETKVDTIGGKYPFIFRNGNTSYKEFPISGLITLLSDENELFFEDKEKNTNIRRYTLQPPYDTANGGWWYSLTGLSEQGLRNEQESQFFNSPNSLSADNFRREREFKMQVLNWLTNGEPKLFRSPGEGNFIVRLMNTSLTPNDTLSRMLHTFSCTAYEIDDYNLQTLNSYNFINAYHSDYQELKFKMLDGHTVLKFNEDKGEIPALVVEGGAYYMAIIDQYGPLVVKFKYANGTSSTVNCGNSSGQYVFDTEALKNNPITSIVVLSGVADVNSKILYGYYDTSDIAFSLISHITRETKQLQLIGHPQITYRDDSFNINYIDAIKNGIGYWNSRSKKQIKYISDDIPRKVLGKFYYLKAEPREQVDIYYKSNKYYYTNQCNHEIYTWDDSALYRVHKEVSGSWEFDKQYSGRPSHNINLENPSYLFKLNASPNNGQDGAHEEFIDLSLKGGSAINAPITTGRYEIYFDLDKLENLNIGSGVVCEIVYNLSTINYEAEENNRYTSLKNKKNNWNSKLSTYNTKVQQNGALARASEEARVEMEQAYNDYLTTLKETLDDIQEQEESYYVL